MLKFKNLIIYIWGLLDVIYFAETENLLLKVL